jgi:hypothetical protein
VLGAASILLILSLAARLITSWENFGDLDTPSGVWATMAVDLASDGTLYRPVVSPLGYGGTRYAPLHPVVQAGLIRLGMTAVSSGYLIALISTLSVVAALCVLIRQMGVSPLLAAITALLAMSANCYLEGIAKIHGDPLALALELWGLVLLVRLADRPTDSPLGWLMLLSIFFSLALSAKITGVFALTAGLAWLALRGQRREAIQLFIAWTIGVAVLVLATQWASHGRAISVFRESVAGGGGITALLEGPRRFFGAMIHFDRVTFGFWIFALAVLMTDRTWKSLPALLFIITTAGTMVIFGSPGTGINHLMSMQAASIFVLGAGLAQARPLRLPAVAAALTLLALGSINCWKQAIELRGDHEKENLQAILSDIRRSSVTGPIYANNPLLPILAGQRPYLLDGFMARMMRQKDPASAAKLWDDLEHARFSAVITHSHPTGWSDVVTDDALIASHLAGEYHLFSTHGTAQVYLPDPK